MRLNMDIGLPATILVIGLGVVVELLDRIRLDPVLPEMGCSGASLCGAILHSFLL